MNENTLEELLEVAEEQDENWIPDLKDGEHETTDNG